MTDPNTLTETKLRADLDAVTGRATYWMSRAANLAAQLLVAEAALREARSYYGVEATVYVVKVLDGYTPTFTTRGLTVTAGFRTEPVPGHTAPADSEESH